MEHTKHHWGVEMVLADTDEYSGKMIFIHEGKQTPYIYF